MHPVLHQVRYIEHRITSIQAMTLQISRLVNAGSRCQRNTRRMLTVGLEQPGDDVVGCSVSGPLKQHPAVLGDEPRPV